MSGAVETHSGMACFPRYLANVCYIRTCITSVFDWQPRGFRGASVNCPAKIRGTESPMIFRQLFDSVSSTYTYLIASRHGGEALIIDPVLEKVDRYLQLIHELDLRLIKAVDTHLHADHVTGLGALRDRTQCITVMGEKTHADVVSMRVTEGDSIEIEGLNLDVLYTPGHTDDSYSFLMGDRVFTLDHRRREAVQPATQGQVRG
jgi:hypothetical protein